MQVFCQPLFAFIEKWSAKKWPKSDFVTTEYAIPIPFFGIYQLNLFRLVWRTIFVIMTTLISMFLPFFNAIVGILGAFGFWPLTVFFPIEMYISQKKIAPCTSRWFGLEIISVTRLFIFIAAVVGSFAGFFWISRLTSHSKLVTKRAVSLFILFFLFFYFFL